MNVRDLIHNLGGPKRLGEVLDEPMKTVSSWGARDSVPAEHRVRVWRLARQAGLDWTPPGFEGLALVESSSGGSRP